MLLTSLMTIQFFPFPFNAKEQRNTWRSETEKFSSIFDQTSIARMKVFDLANLRKSCPRVRRDLVVAWSEEPPKDIDITTLDSIPDKDTTAALMKQMFDVSKERKIQSISIEARNSSGRAFVSLKAVRLWTDIHNVISKSLKVRNARKWLSTHLGYRDEVSRKALTC